MWAFRNSLTRRQKRHARRSDAGHTALAPRSRRPPGVTRGSPDLLADQGVIRQRRLRHVQLLGGAPEVAGFGHHDEIA